MSVPDLLRLVLGGEEDQNREVFFDIDKAVVDLFSDEDDRSRLHRTSFAGNNDRGTTLDHVVDLVFGVRRLPVDRASLEDIEAEAHRAFVKKLQVRISALRLLLTDLAIFERVHHLAPRALSGRPNKRLAPVPS